MVECEHEWLPVSGSNLDSRVYCRHCLTIEQEAPHASGPSDQFTCRICGKSMDLDDRTKAMMAVFGMPRDSGAHARCLGI